MGLVTASLTKFLLLYVQKTHDIQEQEAKSKIKESVDIGH